MSLYFSFPQSLSFFSFLLLLLVFFPCTSSAPFDQESYYEMYDRPQPSFLNPAPQVR